MIDRKRDRETIQAWLLANIAGLTGLPIGEIDPRSSFHGYGLSSADAVTLSGELGEWLGQSVSATLAYEYPTIAEAAAFLAGEQNGPPQETTGTARRQKEPIAIIGMACRFPGADDVAAFWELLRAGIDPIRVVPKERWNVAEYHSPNPGQPGKMNTRWGGFLDKIDEFDAHFFSISPREAERMDPQQRILMELFTEMLEDAAVPAERLAGSATGVFLGISNSDYARLAYELRDQVDAYAATGNALSIAANRISYSYDLHGPSMAIDTACSSGLVAVHLACQSLISGDSECAVAGAVNVVLAPEITIAFSQAGALASDGRCKPFDAHADGYTRSDGAGMVMLKPLSTALRDGNRIHALIRGSAVNQDGRSNGLTAPNRRSQEAVLRKAYCDAGVNPGAVQYVETHGSGTPLGDPIEAAALATVMGEGRCTDSPCLIGSVKGSIGHTEAAAGIAGLIKTVLALRHCEIPASLHFDSPNPHIEFDRIPVRVVRTLQPWPETEGGRLAGISSFGFGGTNAHVVIQEPPSTRRSGRARSWQLLSWSAKTATALDAVTEKLAQHLLNNPHQDLADVAYTLHTGRSGYPFRRIAVCQDAVDASSILLVKDAARLLTAHASPSRRKLVFAFPSLACGFPSLSHLYEEEPAFRSDVQLSGQLFAQHCGIDFSAKLVADGIARSTDTAAEQAAAFAAQYALARLLIRWGVKPDAALAYGTGHCTAACVCGVLSLDDAALIAARTAELLEQSWEMEMPPRARQGAVPEWDCNGVRQMLAALQPKAPRIPLLLSATARNEHVPSREDLVQHLLGRACVDQEMLLRDPEVLLLGLGPRDIAPSHDPEDASVAHSLACMAPCQKNDFVALLQTLGKLWMSGAEVDWRSFYEQQERQAVDLPSYPFERQRYWLCEDSKRKKSDLATSQREQRKDVSQWFYLPGWEAAPVATSVGDARRFRWLIFSDALGVGLSLAEELREKAETVVQVRIGSEFTASGGMEFSINPARAEDYQSLFRALEASGRLPDRIAHLWSLGATCKNDDFRSHQTLGFESLLHISRAFAGLHHCGPMGIKVVSSQLHKIQIEDHACPAKSTLIAAARAIHQEFETIQCCSVEVECDASGLQRPTDLRHLVAEMYASYDDPVVAYRGSQRLVQHFESCTLPAAPSSARLRDGGTYLITGGLGGIGLLLAEYLGRSVKANLVLVSRRHFPVATDWDDWLASHDADDATSRTIRRLRAVKESGARITIARADVADLSQMQRVADDAIEQSGGLHGIIHGAGILNPDSFSLLRQLDFAQCERHFRPKVDGVHVLREIASRHHPEWVLLLSSISSVLGGLGFAAYAAANAFMDSFAQAEAPGGPTEWTSVNVESWITAEDPGASALAGPLAARFAMQPQEGVEAFHRILSARFMPRIVISTADFTARVAESQRKSDAAKWKDEIRSTPARRHERPCLMTAFVAPRTSMEKRIAEVWQEFLGLTRVGIYDNFIELGGNSLIAMQMLARMKQSTGIDLALATVLTHPTIARLAVALELAMVDRLEALTPDQTRKLVETEPLAHSAR